MLRAILLAWTVALMGSVLLAQSRPESPADKPATTAREAAGVSDPTLKDLIATLKDEGRRKQLVDQLEAMVATREAQKAPAPGSGKGRVTGLAGFLDRVASQVRSTVAQILTQAARIPDRVGKFWLLVHQTERRNTLLANAGILVALVLAASLVAYLVRRLLRWLYTRVTRVRGDRPFNLLSRCWRLATRALLDLAPAVAYPAAGLLLISILAPPPTVRLLLLIVLWALAIRRTAGAAIDLVFSARHASIRLLPFSDEVAADSARSLGRLAALGVFGFFLMRATVVLRAEPELVQSLTRLYGLLLFLGGIVFVLRTRGPVSTQLAALRSGDADATGGGVPRRWHSFVLSLVGLWWVAVLGYIFALYLTWTSGLQGGFAYILRATAITAVALAAWIVALATLRALHDRLLKATAKPLRRYPQLEARLPGYFRGVRVVLETAVGILAVCVALEGWGLDALEAIQTESALGLVSVAVNLLLIILLAAATTDVAAVFAQRYLEGRERAGRATGKVRTLVPLVRSTIRVVVLLVAAILILSELGLDIGPILAGVGVLGLAVGFGAQTLVKDIITGFFILIENSISVGDVAKLGDRSGLVEAINLRTVRLRDLTGSVHVIPYSAVGTVTNMTKEFSFAVIEAGVAYREDVDEVIEVLKEVGDEMQKDPEFGPDILEAIEIQGLDRFEDSAVIVRARLKTMPIRRWRVGREFNRRMKKAFDARNIEIPFPHRTLYMGEPKEGPSPALRIEHAAVAEVKERPPESSAHVESSASSEASTPDAGSPGPGGRIPR